MEPPADENNLPEPLVDVLVVDDSDTFRDLLRELVLATPGMRYAGGASSGEAGLGAAERLAPRLVIMDKRMPGMGGVAAARELSIRFPEIVVVLVSVEHLEPDDLEASAAAAFVPKQRLSPRTLRALWDEHGSS